MKNDLRAAQRFTLAKVWDVIEAVVYRNSAGCPKAMREINAARRRAFASLFDSEVEISAYHGDEEAA